jgi:hypothetical protein
MSPKRKCIPKPLLFLVLSFHTFPSRTLGKTEMNIFVSQQKRETFALGIVVAATIILCCLLYKKTTKKGIILEPRK